MNLRSTWAIARKDLLDVLQTLRLLIFILMPIGFSLFYRAVFASAGDVTVARLVIYDAGRSRLPQVLAQRENVRVIAVNSLEELQRVVIGARAVGGVVLPSGYDTALTAGKRPAIQLFANGQLGVGSPKLIHMVEPALRAVAGQQLPARIETLTANTDSKDTPRPGFDLQRFLLIMFLIVGSTMTAVMIPASMLVEEKEQHTLKAVLSVPVSYADLLAGKGITGLTCALLSCAIILALNGGLERNVGLTSLVLLLTSLFLVEIGLLLGSLFNSLATLNMWSFVALVPLTLPAVVVPAANLGLLHMGAGAWVLRAIPTYYAVDGVLRTVSGAVSLRAVGIDLLVLSASALVFFAANVALLRRREK